MDSIEYRSNFEDWDEKSWIRTKPRRVGNFDPDKDFFSRGLSTTYSSGRTFLARNHNSRHSNP